MSTGSKYFGDSTSTTVISTATSPIRSGRGIVLVANVAKAITFSEPFAGGRSDYRVNVLGWDSATETTERLPIVIKFAISSKSDTGFTITPEENGFGDYTATLDT